MPWCRRTLTRAMKSSRDSGGQVRRCGHVDAPSAHLHGMRWVCMHMGSVVRWVGLPLCIKGAGPSVVGPGPLGVLTHCVPSVAWRRWICVQATKSSPKYCGHAQILIPPCTAVGISCRLIHAFISSDATMRCEGIALTCLVILFCPTLLLQPSGTAIVHQGSWP